jgi:hypothetical protein
VENLTTQSTTDSDKSKESGTENSNPKQEAWSNIHHRDDDDRQEHIS